MRNQFHYYILFLCTAAFHASVLILRVFRLAILGAKAGSSYGYLQYITTTKK